MAVSATLLLTVACRHDVRPADVMDHDAMVGFLTDAYVVEGFYAIETQFRYDEPSPESVHLYDSILTLHGVTREEVERSLDYYSTHLEEYRVINEDVKVRLEALSDSLAH